MCVLCVNLVYVYVGVSVRWLAVRGRTRLVCGSVARACDCRLANLASLEDLSANDGSGGGGRQFS